MNRTRRKYGFFGLAAWVGLTGASCLSGDDAPAGGHIEHPPPRAPAPVASVKGTQDGPPPAADGFTPFDQAIADGCDHLTETSWGRRWSQNVPDSDCTNDGECGDGFCDLGHCAAIWTCAARWGQRCINGLPVPARVHSVQYCQGICLDGRCRSCRSDADCVKKFQAQFGVAPGPTDGIMCSPDGASAGGSRTCGIRGPQHKVYSWPSP